MSPYLACNLNLSCNWNIVILPVRFESQSTIYCKTLSPQWSYVTSPQLQREMSPFLTSHFAMLYWCSKRKVHRVHLPFLIFVRAKYPEEISHLLTNLWAIHRSQWPRGLRRVSTAARLLGLWVRIPPRAWISVSCECCVMSGRGLCVGLVPRPEESYRVCCV
jgi:hypothetical protein